MKVFGLIGDHRVQNSLSPMMFEAVFSALRYDARYVAFNLDQKDLQRALNAAKSAGMVGLNVTVPYKESVIPYIDSLSPKAAQVGAVNTIAFRQDHALGFNTDIGGFIDMLEHCGISANVSDVCVVGAGGAAKAVIYSFITSGCRSVNVINRTYSKSCEVASRVGGIAIRLEDAIKVLETCSLLVNTTSISETGQAPEFTSLFFGNIRFKKLHTIIDINYGRQENLWHLLAQRIGARFVDGLFMLAAQARRSFFLWTGETVRIEEFLKPLGSER